MATEGVGVGAAAAAALGSSVNEAAVVDEVRYKSPRITASAWMTVFPPRMMRWVPWIWARREILFPVSWIG